MKIKSLLLGLLLFSFLMINTVLDGAVIYLQLLKHKQDPNKFIILVADIHGLHPEIEKMQIRITDDLLAILKKLLQPLNVEFLFECAQSDIDIVLEKLGKKITTQEDLLGYIMYLYTVNQLPSVIHPIACDIKNTIDETLLWLQHELFNIQPPVGNYNNFKEWINARIKSTTAGQTKEPSIAKKGTHAEIIKQSPLRINYGKSPVTVEMYLKRLDELEKFIHNALPLISASQRAFFISEFTKAKKEAEEIVKSFNPGDSLIYVASSISKKFSNEIDASIQMVKLLKPSMIARDLKMLTGILQSQQQKPLTILLAGALHIASVENILLNTDYTLVKNLYLYDSIKQNSNGSYSFKGISEEQIWKALKDFISGVPIVLTGKVPSKL